VLLLRVVGHHSTSTGMPILSGSLLGRSRNGSKEGNREN
jgi:hypothetical protein